MITLTSTPSSIKRAAKATERSSSPLTDHITAFSSNSKYEDFDFQGIKFEVRFSGTVMVSRPYIIDKLNAVVSYIIEEPSLKLACFSFTRTDSSIFASNSIIAAINGASD